MSIKKSKLYASLILIGMVSLMLIFATWPEVGLILIGIIVAVGIWNIIRLLLENYYNEN